jgi:hypothetical protein
MVNVKEVNEGDLMAVVMYAEVDGAYTDRISCKNVDTGEGFEVVGDSLIEKMYSADRYNTVTQVTKTQMAEVLSDSFNVPFTVKFEKQDGDIRTLRGRLIEPERLMGRCMVEDLDQPSGKRVRQVDNRTLKELIVKGVKYTLKK